MGALNRHVRLIVWLEAKTRLWGYVGRCGDYSRYRGQVRWISLLQQEDSNIIALLRTSYKPQTVVCSLYGTGYRISSSFHASAAAVWVGHRGATGRHRS